MPFEVGSDVEAMCRVCGDVWHVVVAKVGDKITKVECKECGKQHRFKPTGDAPQINLEPTRRTIASAPGPKLPKSKVHSSIPTHDPSKPTRPYSMRERFELGEQVSHKKFGSGVVVGVEDSKIRVSFAEGVKTLLHRKD